MANHKTHWLALLACQRLMTSYLSDDGRSRLLVAATLVLQALKLSTWHAVFHPVFFPCSFCLLDLLLSSSPLSQPSCSRCGLVDAGGTVPSPSVRATSCLPWHLARLAYCDVPDLRKVKL
ncbi:hypothetical protein BD289DRAFT_438427 [Coniella lustricola]|uniref:Uncharacterized protein n=1 Tax=Coniella lustricola TaxID=2025994 RepID=A0A2T3A2Z3_9PEZI|nr:hypothetical protein BD289DRAFT_438427 [Coniella lustricola]